MEAIDFINGVRKSVIEENLTAYKEIFENTDQASDPYWQKALSLFSSLNEQQRDTLYKIIRQVEVDTVSTILGILDGTTYIDGQASNLELRVENENKLLNGDLQDIFLEIEEG